MKTQTENRTDVSIIKIKNKTRAEKKKELRADWLLLKNELTKYAQNKTPEELQRSASFQKLAEYYKTINVELCRYDLGEFIAQAWKPVTSVDYIPAWYIDVISDHMESLYDLEFAKLIINLSPRSGKSTILSQIYPVWLWLQDPRNKILTVSYRRDLSMRDARSSRDLINSNFFQVNWGHLFEWATDQNAKTYYENQNGGNRMGLSVGASPTGFGYHYICMDDINSGQDATSPAKLRGAIEYYEGSLRTRWQSPETFRQVCLQQRISTEDMSGYLEREHGDWVILRLPEEYTGVKHIGYRGIDQRNHIGEILKPKLFSREYIEKEKKNPFFWEAQFQQNPIPPGGAYVKHDDLRFWKTDGINMRPALEEFNSIFMSVDLSDGSLDNGSSFNCFLIIGLIGAKIFVLDIVLEKLAFPDQIKTFLKLRNQYNTSFQLVEELSNGRALCDFLEREYTVNNNVRIQPKEYGGDKFTRFSTTLHHYSQNHVWLPHHTVNAKSKTCADQMITFPKGVNDDFVDALSQAINYIDTQDYKKGGGVGRDCALDVNEDYNDSPFSNTSLSDIISGNESSLSEVRGLF